MLFDITFGDVDPVSWRIDNEINIRLVVSLSMTW